MADEKNILYFAILTPSTVTNGSRLVIRAIAFGRVGDRIDESARQFYGRCASTRKTRDLGQHLPESHVLAAQNVALSDTSATQGGDVSRSNIVDVDEIEAGIHKGRHPS